jgi:hypothetical protein
MHYKPGNNKWAQNTTNHQEHGPLMNDIYIKVSHVCHDLHKAHVWTQPWKVALGTESTT